MRYLALSLIITGLLLFGGCQNDKLTECQQQLEETREELTLAKKELENEKAAFEKAKTDLMSQISVDNTEINVLKSRTEKLNAEKADIVKQQQEFKAETDKGIAGFEANIKKLESRVMELKEQLSESSSRIKKLEAKSAATREELKQILEKM